jgi:hypothetical protein
MAAAPPTSYSAASAAGSAIGAIVERDPLLPLGEVDPHAFDDLVEHRHDIAFPVMVDPASV